MLFYRNRSTADIREHNAPVIGKDQEILNFGSNSAVWLLGLVNVYNSYNI